MRYHGKPSRREGFFVCPAFRAAARMAPALPSPAELGPRRSAGPSLQEDAAVADANTLSVAVRGTGRQGRAHAQSLLEIGREGFLVSGRRLGVQVLQYQESGA